MPPENAFLTEISQELTRFDHGLRGLFRCPTCLRDLPIENFGSADERLAITEEHIIPGSVGGKATTFLCKKCNSLFGHKQTRWLSSWIELNEGGTPFHRNPKRQRASLSADGRRINGVLKLAEDGAIDFYADRDRSNPKDFDAYWLEPKPTEITITHQMPVFANEEMLRVGFLTAAYGLWFKNFGYSWILQSSLNIVRAQILKPDADVIAWNYVIETPEREIKNPSVGLMRFGEEYFPIAVIYDHIVILPSATRSHPPSTTGDQISKKVMVLSPRIADRYQSRCVGPAVLICDSQEIISPNLIAVPTVPPQYIWLDRWD